MAKIVHFFNRTRLLLKSCQDFRFLVASGYRVQEMKPDYSCLCMLLIDHAITDDHPIQVFIVSKNQPKLKGGILLLC